MAFVKAEDYEQALEVVRGKVTLHPVCLRMQAFLLEQYGLQAAGFILDLCESKNQPPRARFKVLLWGGREAYMAVETGNTRRHKEAVAQELVRLVAEDPTYTQLSLDGLFVVFSDFEADIAERIVPIAAKKAIPHLKRRYRRLRFWRIEPVFTYLSIFFHTNEETERYMADGTCAKLVQEYMKYVRPLDEFGIFAGKNAPVRFDSKEIVDRDYAGSLFYYYR